MRNSYISRRLQERFGDPIGSYAGDAPVGVRSVQETKDGVCDCCGLMPIDGECACSKKDDGTMTLDHGGNMASIYEAAMPCDECGMMTVEGEGCGCTHTDEAAMPCEGCGMMAVEGEGCGCSY